VNGYVTEGIELRDQLGMSHDRRETSGPPQGKVPLDARMLQRVAGCSKLAARSLKDNQGIRGQRCFSLVYECPDALPKLF